MAKITLVGAGSAAFALTLANDICETKSLKESSLTLMDINVERLDAAYAVVEKLIKKKKIKLTLKKSKDLKQSLTEAEFVICSVKVGGYDFLEKERNPTYKVRYIPILKNHDTTGNTRTIHQH